MRIEMKDGEREILVAMLEGPITPACSRLYLRIRRRLLLVGSNYDMPRETLALIAELADAVTQHNAEPVERNGKPERVIEPTNPTPLDEINGDEQELIEAENATLNADATGGAYKGSRIKWGSDTFKSTPRTPISKLEKGRPITYISPADGRERAGKFVRVNSKDKSKVNVISSEKKLAFSVPMKNITVTDLSPPSTEPLAVQI